MSDEENVLYGGPQPTETIDEYGNLGDSILQNFEKHGNKVIYICGDTGNTLTADKLRSKSIRLAECLRHMGIQPGDTIGICSENQLEYPVVWFATLFVGGKVSSISPSYTEAELHHVVQLSKPKIIFSTNLNLKIVAKVFAKNSFIQNVVTFEKQKIMKNALDYYAVLDNKSVKSMGEFKCTPIKDDATLLILVSSGTTGLPKGVELTCRNFKKHLAYAAEYNKNIREMFGALTVLSVLPWFHAYGMITSMTAAFLGETIITFPKFNEKKYLEAIVKYQAQVLFVVPPILIFLTKSPMVKSYDLSSVRIIGSGAAPLRKEVVESLSDIFPGVMVFQGYGLTETTLGVLNQKDSFFTPGSVGSLQPGTWGKVIDVETGKNLGVNQEGELCFKGDYIMKGYVNNESATKNAIDEKGWLHTGDIGYYDENGEWFVVDRIKELIKFKGYQVPPAELEALLITHPKIIDAAVIGIPDEKAGELPIGFVVKKSGEKLSEKDVVDFIADKTSYAKRLHGGVRFISVIPKNPSGKILRRVLRDSLKNQKSKL